jgi:hypothetical protein
MFCNAMIVLPDGRPFILGGTESYGAGNGPFTGLPNTATYDPATGIFSGQQAMAHGRWYPTATVLGDGRVMVLSGAISGTDHHNQNLTGSTNTTVELYAVGSGWSSEYPVPTSWTPPLYPRLHVLPSGKVFYSAPEATSALFDPSTQIWTLDVAATKYGASRGYGTSVLLPLTPENNYDPRVMIFGGASPATSTTEIIDLGASTPIWQSGRNMTQPRIEMNATILPNGKVLATGGSLNDEDTTTASLNADLYDPTSNSFSSAGANAYARLYHSVALLLPDATVWLAGGNPKQGSYEHHMEIYQPAYLFNPDGSAATRPTITSAPGSLFYDTSFTVQTPDAASVSSVVVIRNGAVTHAFNMDQRMVGLSFTAAAEALTVTVPSSENIAPPGYYMLFLLNSQGVPSIASFVHLGSSNPAPTVSGIAPPSGSSNGGTGVTMTGTGFLAGATVKLGGAAASSVVVVSSTSITATTPAHPAGSVDVVVTNSDGQSATLTGGYTYTSASGGGISFVQVKSVTQTSGSSVAISYPVAQTAGDLNAVAVMWGDTTSTVSSVTDSKGNTYALAVGPTKATALTESIYYAKNIAGGSNTITVKFNQTASYPNVNVLEYSGLDTANPLDVSSSAIGSGTTANSGSAMTTSANELIVGAGNPSSVFKAVGSGFSSRIINAYGGISEDRIVSSTGSYNATATLTSGTWVMQMAAFRASAP